MTSRKELEDEFMERLGSISKRWKIGEPGGRILGVLLLEKIDLTQKEISEKTGYSLSLVSPNLKLFEAEGIVYKKRGEGKEKVYGMNKCFTELYYMMNMRFLENDVKPIISILSELVEKDPNPHITALIKEYEKIKKVTLSIGKLIDAKKATKEKIDKVRTSISR